MQSGNPQRKQRVLPHLHHFVFLSAFANCNRTWNQSVLWKATTSKMTPPLGCRGGSLPVVQQHHTRPGPSEAHENTRQGQRTKRAGCKPTDLYQAY